MTYALFTECPAYELIRTDPDKGTPLPARDPALLRWGGHAFPQPPDVGQLVRVAMNGIGPAVVTGYFAESGYLGLRCTLLAEPEWHAKQNAGRTPGASRHSGHVFGAEVAPPDLPAVEACVTLTWRSEDSVLAFRAYNAPWVSPGPMHRRFVAALESGGFEYDARMACWRTPWDTLNHRADAFALAARLRLAGFEVTHAGCYGPAGPPAVGAGVMPATV